MATRGQRGGTRQRPQRRAPHSDEHGIMPVLARAVREVETGARRSPVPVSVRATFQAVAMCVREERTRVKEDESLSNAEREERLKRLDGIATILAKTAVRETSLLQLLDESVEISGEAKAIRRDMLAAAGLEQTPAPRNGSAPTADEEAPVERKVVPQSVIARQLANPFQPPEYIAPEHREPATNRLGGWELLGPLFSSFERAAGAGPACMAMPDDVDTVIPGVPELMKHQAQVVAAAAEGHRTFLLADEPGLGKTAQSLLAAQAAGAFPLLVVVPNVVKTNWAREAALWTPRRKATIIQGDGENIDGFADIVIVNYEVLDRHVGWLGDMGFRGMVLDEAHFIKNKTSQRSQNVLALSERLRKRTVRPLLMALTGTPLINDIDDFRAIWQFLGWIDEKKPRGELMRKLEEAGLTPLDPGFYTAARQCVIDMGIVRRRKIDVAADIPARRIADLPVELDDDAGRSIREAERALVKRLLQRYDRALEARSGGTKVEGTDHELVRHVAKWEREDTESSKLGENVFTMMRRIGQAKAGLAADYTAQLARNVGKVVFFAKHVDVMDLAEETFAKRGLGYSSIRGDQTPSVRQRNIDAFVNDPDVAVAVCSLTAAGVGLNLQVASDVVLAELSWTDAEQQQAIDRVHRIGQDQPVTAWRVIAASTIDTKIVELIDAKAGLAARALDGSDEEIDSTDIQLEALVAMLTEALELRGTWH